MKRAAVLAIALVAAGSLWWAPASEAAAPSRAFGDVALRDVVTIATSDAWAVGDGGIASQWDGAHWTSRHLGGLHTPELNGVAASSSEDVWAVGGVIVQDASRGFASHWDGTGWHREPIPGYPGEVILEDVAVRSTSDAYAVGRWFAVTPGGRRGGAAIVHWSGSAWRGVQAPPVVRSLTAVTVLSGGRYIAVGASRSGPVAVPIASTLPLGVKALPQPAGARCGARDVDGPPVFVVGVCRLDRIVRPYVAERGPGGEWQLRSVSSPVALQGVDEGVATWAVGRSATTGQAVILRRGHGGTWFRVPAPADPRDTALIDVSSRTFNEAWSVGWRRVGTALRPLALRWDGAAWSRVPVPLA